MLIGYARVSTEEQSLKLQKTALRDAGCETIFEDKGISGAVFRRPGFEALLTQIGAGDTLVVWRLDRLGRSLGHLIKTINTLEKNHIDFRSLTENIDTGSSGGRLIFHIMGAIAEFERSLISERTRAGMQVAKRSGQRLGRPPLLSAERKREMLHALAAGASRQAVAQKYKISKRTLDRLSQNNYDFKDSCADNAMGRSALS
jgi:DNA invertase Pin-like site-specific DNA recombinase